MHGCALLMASALVLAMVPVASAEEAIPITHPVCWQDPPPYDPCGPCYGPCGWIPSTDDPVPGRTDPLLTVGGACREGAYGAACETDQCIKQFWAFPACRDKTVCAAWARSVCVWGINYGNARDFAEVVKSNLVPPAPEVLPSQLPTVGGLPSEDAWVVVSGDCGPGSLVGVACRLAPEGEPDPRCGPITELPCDPGDVFMCVYVVVGACAWAYPHLVCLFAPTACTTLCHGTRVYVCEPRPA